MTKNESRNIVKCLAAVSPFEQIFVVDSLSTDDTSELARATGATVIPFEWNRQYPKKKQWCLENLPFKHDWILFVDADEEVPAALADEIREAVSANPGVSGYFIGFDYRFLRKTLRHGQTVFKLALMQRGRAKFLDYEDLGVINMWEVEGHYQPHVEGTCAVLQERMIHDDHDSLFSYFERHNRYSDWEAHLRAAGKLLDPREAQPRGRKLMKRLFNSLPAKPLISFIFGYLIKGGFLDGQAGLHYAIAKSFYYWQIEVKTLENRILDRGEKF